MKTWTLDHAAIVSIAACLMAAIIAPCIISAPLICPAMAAHLAAIKDGILMTEPVDSCPCWNCPMFYDGVCNSEIRCIDCYDDPNEREDENKNIQD